MLTNGGRNILFLCRAESPDNSRRVRRVLLFYFMGGNVEEEKRTVARFWKRKSRPTIRRWVSRYDFIEGGKTVNIFSKEKRSDEKGGEIKRGLMKGRTWGHSTPPHRGSSEKRRYT